MGGQKKMQERSLMKWKVRERKRKRRGNGRKKSYGNTKARTNE